MQIWPQIFLKRRSSRVDALSRRPEDEAVDGAEGGGEWRKVDAADHGGEEEDSADAAELARLEAELADEEAELAEAELAAEEARLAAEEAELAAEEARVRKCGSRSAEGKCARSALSAPPRP